MVTTAIGLLDARPLDRPFEETGDMNAEYTVYPDGDLDIAAVRALEREWWGIIDRCHPGLLVVDLSNVTFLDCSGVGLLVCALKRQRAHGGRLEVRGPRGVARRVLAIAGVEGLLGLPMSSLPMSTDGRAGPGRGARHLRAAAV